MQKIADALQVSPMDIMNQQPAIINLQPNQGTQHAIGYIETFISSQKEMVDKLLSAKDAEIENLKGIIEKLLREKA